jgi:hypothetical protein
MPQRIRDISREHNLTREHPRVTRRCTGKVVDQGDGSRHVTVHVACAVADHGRDVFRCLTVCLRQPAESVSTGVQ